MGRGRVLRIEKTSIHDGEGLRTVVFLNGCPLHCLWCSTPESQCIHGGAEEGRVMTTEQVLKEIRKDSLFFFHSGGGVTLSGGEVLLQPDFARSILAGCREEGIRTAIETSLFADYSVIRRLLPELDEIYADLKIWDDRLHQWYTGVSNQRILENLRQLERDFDGGIHIRIPVIPGVNMNRENMTMTARFLKGMRNVRDIELLPYHRLGLETYRKMGIPYQMKETKTPTPEELSAMAEAIRQEDPDREIKIKGERWK